MTAGYLELMADGRLPSKYYLNSLATGVGKTTLIVAFVGALAESKAHKDVGVIICVPYLDAIKTLIEDLALSKESVAVYTSDKAFNDELGAKDRSSAQVLITTQQMVEARLSNGKQFAALDYFHFNGKPRTVKLWDEALLPWEELVLEVDEMVRMPKLLRKQYPKLADKLLVVSAEIQALKAGSAYPFPDLAVSIDDLRIDALQEQPTLDRKIAHTLCKMSGKTVRVIHDPLTGLCSISWQNKLPEDFMPVMVFDASGHVRTVYDRYGKSSGKLEPFTTSQKLYDNVTFWHVDKGAGKDSWRKYTEALLEATAACINNESDRECLVIHHRADTGKQVKGAIPHIPDSLPRYLKSKDKVRYLHWGMHRQTNEFRDFDKVVLAGLLYLPPRAVEVRARGSMQKPSDEDLAKEDFKAIERGEIVNDFLQAVGRSCVRQCRGDQAHKADVYVLASNKGGYHVPEMLREAFPGCTVNPLSLPGMGKPDWHRAVEYIDAFWSKPDNADQTLRFPVVQKALGIKAAQNFNRDVRRNPEFIHAMKTRLIVETGKRYNKAFQKLPF